MKYPFRRIEKIEKRENIGAYGVWRREFCKEYRELLIRTRNNSYNSLFETLTAKGEMITCRKRCTYCCYHYVAVPLAQGMVIVDYLYQRKGALQKFICNYEKWHHTGHDISNIIDHVRTQALASGKPIERVIALTRPLAMHYLEMDIPCPFLVNNTCLIYDVRPLPCSGQYSVSPPHWCAPATAGEPVIHQLIPDEKDLYEMMQLAGPQFMLYELTLPLMIYKLLTEGAASLIKND